VELEVDWVGLLERVVVMLNNVEDEEDKVVEDRDVVDDVTVLEIKTAVMEIVPELALLLASPGYAASIVTAPGVAPIIDIAQIPPEFRLHVGGEVMLTLPVSPAG
jgi:hypothetical protein